ncbi:serine/threonine protein kinase [Pontiella sulfatireligans]|nr:serine/threonine-protein kinase [Pontiella sulfatireligans]
MSMDSTAHGGPDRDMVDDLYENKDNVLSEKEAESLNPILKSLTDNESRYDEPVLMAEGGEKRIYRVYDGHLNRFVAMAKASRAVTERDQEQFLREGQLTANLTHPNIVPVYNVGIDSEGTPFFSMELIPGDSLRDIIHELKKGNASYKTQYPLETLLGIFSKVCDALSYAHSREVLHLDIKPDNIRVGQFGEVFLCDWGLARVIHEEKAEPPPGELDSDILNDMTLTGTMKGTPGFMAPEQTVREGNKTIKTDIYALGALLYNILTHEIPVKGSSANEVVENTRVGKIVPPRKRCPEKHIPQGLAAVALKALAFDPNNRYGSVLALQAEIQRFVSGFPTEAERAGPVVRLTLLAQRHRKLTFWLTAFLAVLAIVMSINLSIISRKHRAAETNFALFRNEQEETNRINKELTDLSILAQEIPNYTHAHRMQKLTEKLLALGRIEPDRLQVVLRRQATGLLVTQQFNEAIKAYEKLTDPSQHTLRRLKLCREYATLKPEDWKSLSGPELAQLLATHYSTLSGSLAKLIYYHDCQSPRSRNPEEHIAVVGIMLVRHNDISNAGKIPHLKLNRRPKGWHLDLSRTPYSSYRIEMTSPVEDLNILQSLQLYSLDISHTPVSLVKELRYLEIKELRMVGAALQPAKGLVGLFESMGLERLVLGKGDYPEGTIRFIRSKGIEVVEEEYEH